MIYERRPRWMKVLATLGVILYTVFAGIGCGWVMVKLIGMIG